MTQGNNKCTYGYKKNRKTNEEMQINFELNIKAERTAAKIFHFNIFIVSSSQKKSKSHIIITQSFNKFVSKNSQSVMLIYIVKSNFQ